MAADLPVTRRTALKGLASAVGIAGAGGAALYYGTGPATAAQVAIADTAVSVDDGHLSFVDLDLADYYAIWDGFDVPVAAVGYKDILVYDGDGSEHTLYDQTGVDAQPIMLDAISSEGDGGDGWGGPGEYASTFGTKTTPDTNTINQPGVNGNPAEATAGWVHADVLWRIISDDDADTGHSIEDPAVHGGSGPFPSLDVDADGESETHMFTLRKQVHLYRSTDPGTGVSSLQTVNGETVWPMGEVDGTEALVEATPSFGVTVENTPSEDSTSGSGSTTSG